MKSRTSNISIFALLIILGLIIPNIVYGSKTYINGTNGVSIETRIINLQNLIPICIFSLIFGGILCFIIYLTSIFPLIQKKKIKEYSQKNGFKFVDKSKKLPIEEKLYTANIADKTDYSLIEMGRKNDIAFILCQYNHDHNKKERNYKFGYDTICFMTKEGVDIPHFVIGEYEPSSKNFLNGCLLESLKLKKIFFKEDKNFGNRFFVKSEEPEVKKFFDEKMRSIFLKIKDKSYYYEGKKNCFVVSCSSGSNAENRISFLNFSIDLFNKIIQN